MSKPSRPYPDKFVLKWGVDQYLCRDSLFPERSELGRVDFVPTPRSFEISAFETREKADVALEIMREAITTPTSVPVNMRVVRIIPGAYKRIALAAEVYALAIEVRGETTRRGRRGRRSADALGACLTALARLKQEIWKKNAR